MLNRNIEKLAVSDPDPLEYESVCLMKPLLSIHTTYMYVCIYIYLII